MASEIFTNPVATGLLGGAGVLLIQFIFSRVVGNDVKSLPMQLSEINSKLAEINATLLLIKNDADHVAATLDELKDDFWKHMDRYHSGHTGTPTPSGGYRPSHSNPHSPARP